MISESGGRAVVIVPSALGSKDHPTGLPNPAAENPAGDIPAAEDLSAECREGSVASFQT